MFKKVNLHETSAQARTLAPTFAAREAIEPIPRYALPEHGMAARTAYQLVHDELMLDGNSRLNLATFVTTWMEDEARQLMQESFDKNMIDKDEYPQTAELEMRCVNILARLWNSPDHEEATGCSTTGSSEAAMLGGMALKWNWRKRRQAEGKADDRPNMVMGANVQVCWEKFCRYWEVEPRFVPCEGDRFILDPELAASMCDENTIGVVAIMGSTYDGSYEPVQALNTALDKLQSEKDLDIAIHVDGASGGFIAPFLQPELVWDFRLPRVKSINTSGHKFGLVYPGVGWVIWRDKAELPEELIFHCAYLGGDLPNFALNFSRPGNQVVAQYYNFIRLGREGYTRIQQASQDVALYLSAEIAKLGPFELVSDGSDIPVFCWKLKAPTNFSLYDMAESLRHRGWLVPAYPMPANRKDLVVQRIVVREGLSRDMAELLLDDMRRALAGFARQPDRHPTDDGSHFHH
jgi:glutamate decarboxylase